MNTIRMLEGHATAWLAVLILTALPAAASAAQVTDSAIADAVEDEMLVDQAVSSYQVDVMVDDGVVTLTGDVDNALARERAMRIAETIRGVDVVVNDIDVQPPLTKSDLEIERDVASALLRDPAADSYEIEVDAEDGLVTLEGEVESWTEADLSRTIALGVAGVIGVVDEIDVDPEIQRPDREIEADVEQAMRWNVLVDDHLVDVRVSNGKVRLDGSVSSAAEKRLAESLAWVAGVEHVNTSKLDVRGMDVAQDGTPPVDMSDARIRNAVENSLIFEPRVLSTNVRTSVQDGVVTLRGAVGDLAAKRAAADAAMDVWGVDRVRNRLRVDPQEDMSPRVVEASIEAGLATNPYVNEEDDVTVRVNNGVATLDGTVDTWFELAEADRVAARTDGVQKVVNNLEVSADADFLVYDPWLGDGYHYDFDWYVYRPATTMASDADIAQDVRSQIFWSPFVDSDEVTVTVDDGVVQLTGTVDSWSESRAAVENAYEGGATWVDNDLRIDTGGEAS